MSFFFGLMLAPFVALLLIAFARWLSRGLRRMPEGWLKRILFFSWRV